MRKGIATGLFVLLAGGGPTAAAAADEPRHLVAGDVFGLEYADDPQVAPDGRAIVYVRASNDIMRDRTRRTLWTLGIDGAGHRPLLGDSAQASSPRFSPDGSRLAFISGAGGKPQIHVRDLASGATGPITNLTESPSALAWSPDGRSIAFVMRVPADKPALAKPPARPEGAEWAAPVKVIDSVIYRFDGRGYIDPGFSHVFVVPAEGGTARQLTSGDYDHGGPLAWSADGTRIVVSANRGENAAYERNERDLFSVALADGAIVRLTDLPGIESNPAVSPDGRSIAFLRGDHQGRFSWITRLALIDADGGNPRILTDDLDRSVSDPQWAADGKSLHVAYDDRGVRKVARVDLSGGLRVVAEGLGGTTLGRPYTSGAFAAARDGAIVYTGGSAGRPADIHVARRGTVRRLTDLNEDLLGHRDLGEVHEIVYPSSFDGTEIQGWYLTPPGFDPARKYPLILEIHGGPVAAYGPHFSAEMQLYAARGYVIFYDNHRGSSSYGEAFRMLLDGKYSSPEDFADHMSGVDALIARGFIDPDNLFITGGSAGGIASAYAVGLTDRFRAAAVVKPIINWLSKTLTGDIYTVQIAHQFPAMPWEALEHYWQRSPLSLAGNVTTPTLLMTGEQDFRTPISEAEQFYQALKLRRVDTVLVRVPGASHNIAARPSHLIAKVDNILAWFERYRRD